MITRAARVRFAVFLVVAAIGTLVVGGQYVGLDRSLWNRPYMVTVNAPSSGGIFDNAEVSYRGTAVGRVRKLDLSSDGVRIKLALDKGIRVPADVQAVIANRSAIGEQFVDLEPQNDGPPWLANGDEIASDRVSLPPRLEEVLLSVKDLTDSVDQQALHTLVTELGRGFDGIGPDLQGIIDHTDAIVTSLNEAFPATRTVLRKARTVLATQRQTSGELSTWSQSLESLSASVAHADPKVRTLLNNTAAALPVVSKLVTDNDQQLPLLMRDLVTVGDIVRTRVPGIRVFLVAFPKLVQDTFNVVQGDGYVHFNLVLDYSSGVCTSAGYRHTVKSVQAKPVSELGNPAKRADLNGYCAEKPGSITAVRGSQNVPLLPGDTYDPATTFVENPRRGRLGPDAQPPVSYETNGDAAVLPSPVVQSATLNRRTGLVTTGGKPVLVLGPPSEAHGDTGLTGWRWLLLNPMLNGGYLP
jgi:phospholipid/cholesterol/gamma-HCH transport system substrate-binding protein